MVMYVYSIYALCSGRAAFIGLGFADRGDSFDLLVSIQDHFKYDAVHCSLWYLVVFCDEQNLYSAQ